MLPNVSALRQTHYVENMWHFGVTTSELESVVDPIKKPSLLNMQNVLARPHKGTSKIWDHGASTT